MDLFGIMSNVCIDMIGKTVIAINVLFIGIANVLALKDHFYGSGERKYIIAVIPFLLLTPAISISPSYSILKAGAIGVAGSIYLSWPTAFVIGVQHLHERGTLTKDNMVSNLSRIVGLKS